MAKEVDSRLDAAMQALQASLLVDDAMRQEEGEAIAPAIEASATGEIAESSLVADAGTALDLATLASASDQAADVPSWALIGGATVLGISAIVVVSVSTLVNPHLNPDVPLWRHRFGESVINLGL